MDEDTLDGMRMMMAKFFALQSGLLAVIATHPDPTALRQALDHFEDAGLSNMQYQPWPDQHLADYRATVETLRRQIPPPKP